MKKSWKTTLAGVLTAVGAALLKSDEHYLQIAGQGLSIVGPFLLGMAARDNDKSSEVVGAK